jgi:N-acetylglucosamine malate deacetylase 1
MSTKSAMIVAPHPDDETFGCGGLIKLKRSASIPVRVIIVSDGEAVEDGRNEQRGTVINARKQDAINACQRLGVDVGEIRWLHFPDGKLPRPEEPGFQDVTQSLLAELHAFEPEEVYCPHLLDVHPDHIATTLAIQQALRLWNKPCALSFYPTWMWHAGRQLHNKLDTSSAWRLDISTARKAKKHAMESYLNSSRTAEGAPFCGCLPWGFLWNFRRKYEVYFTDSSHGVDAIGIGKDKR